MSAVRDLLHHYQHVISAVEIITGGSGVFEVEVDGEVLYSKAITGRHAHDGEVLELFRSRIVPDVAEYERG